MTIAELCAWGIPSILIPLPTAAADHQTPNAEVMAQAGAAVHLPQSRLSSAGLASVLSGLLASPARLDEMAGSARARARPDAVERISDRIGFLSG